MRLTTREHTRQSPLSYDISGHNETKRHGIPRAEISPDKNLTGAGSCFKQTRILPIECKEFQRAFNENLKNVQYLNLLAILAFKTTEGEMWASTRRGEMKRDELRKMLRVRLWYKLHRSHSWIFLVLMSSKVQTHGSQSKRYAEVCHSLELDWTVHWQSEVYR